VTLFPRLAATQRLLSEARIGRLHARLQRNVLREQRDRALEAISEVNAAYAADRPAAFHDAMRAAVALSKVAEAYEATQALTDSSYDPPR
jgi:hypothetical protein